MLGLRDLGYNNIKVLGGVVLGGGNTPSLQEAVPGLAKLSVLHHDMQQ